MQEAGSKEAEISGQAQKATDVAAVWGVPMTAVHCAHCGEAHLVPERYVLSPGTGCATTGLSAGRATRAGRALRRFREQADRDIGPVDRGSPVPS
jgi:hypothetical protein